MEEGMTGMSLADRLLSAIRGATVDDVYMDEDEEGHYLGVVFTIDEMEYHLTFQEDGTVQLAMGEVEGESLEEVITFNLADIEPPFSGNGLLEN